MAVLKHPEWGYLVHFPANGERNYLPAVWTPNRNLALEGEAFELGREARKWWAIPVLEEMEIEVLNRRTK